MSGWGLGINRTYRRTSIFLYVTFSCRPFFLGVELETGKQQARKYTFHPAFSVGFDLMGYSLARLALVAGHGTSQHWVELIDTSILDLDGQNCYEYHYITLKNKFELWS